MQPSDEDLGQLWRMCRAGRDAVELARELSLERLSTEMKEQHALTHAVEQLGEAASRLSAEFRPAYPQIEWRSVIGLRHRLVHDYERTKWRVMLRVAQQSIPQLLDVIEPLIPPPTDEDGPL
jgi:uncharacterized protein with HEPN domain